MRDEFDTQGTGSDNGGSTTESDGQQLSSGEALLGWFCWCVNVRDGVHRRVDTPWNPVRHMVAA